jgi:hypothetical protein
MGFFDDEVHVVVGIEQDAQNTALVSVDLDALADEASQQCVAGHEGGRMN